MDSTGEEASSPAQAAAESPSGESKTQTEARLRRERRNAKIQAGGSARLSKIMASSGRPVAAEEELAKPSTRSTKAASSSQPTSKTTPAADPAEVDISKIFQKPQDDMSMHDQQELFRQMLAATGPPQQQGAGLNEQIPGAEDPIMRMMQQMLGGAGGGSGPGSDGLPPGLANMFGGQPQSEPQNNADYLWRIVHAVLSLLLGLYATFSLTFSGSELGRIKYAEEGIGPKFFWIFATAELMLQSTRYFLDGGKLPVSGLLGGLGRMLPEPYANYVRIISRYSIIYTTILSDAMVVIFVLGFMAWWKGL